MPQVNRELLGNIGDFMNHKSIVGNCEGDKSNAFKELPLTPRPGPGKESRIKNGPRSFLSEIQIRSAKHSKEGRSGGVKRGGRAVHREPRTFQQRVLIKSRVVRTKGRGSRGLNDHVRYLQREGVGTFGNEPQGFSAEQELSRDEVTSLTKDWGEDRHHFRFIVSPEQGSELDLKLFARKVMERVSSDLNTPLQWLAVSHHNTDNPHVHIVLRGRDGSGADLVLTRDYISRGMRAVAEDIATRELGVRNEFDIQKEIQKSITEHRVTPIDRSLEKDAALHPSRLVDLRIAPPPGHDFAVRNRNNRLFRLQHLEGLGLATEVDVGIWKMDEKLIDRLQSLGSRNDIIKLLHRRMRGVTPNQEVNFLTPGKSLDSTIVGRVVHSGLSDELYDTRFVLITGTDNRLHHVTVPQKGDCSQSLEPGDTVAVRVKSENLLTKADRNIAAFSALNAGTYDLDAHEAHAVRNISLPSGVSTQDYIQNHRKRINSLIRMGLVEELSTKSFKIPHNLVEQLSQRTRSYLTIEVLSREQDQQLSRGR